MTPPTDRPQVAVVLVDGHAVLRDQLATFLRDAGVDVLAAVSTLREGRDAVTRCHPDLVIADYRLPDGPGSCLCRIPGPQSQSAPVVLHSTTLTAAQTLEGHAAGAAAVILKSVRRDELLTAIREHARTTDPFATG